MRRKIHYFLVLMLLASTSLSAKTWHVSKDGSNTNDGSEQSPVRTINKAATYALAGDSIIIHAGVYREWVDPANTGISPHRPIVYMAKDGDEVWIKGSEQITTWEKKGKNVWIAEVPNTLFGDYNPFEAKVFGDWLVEGDHLHLGEVYLNNVALIEKQDIESVETTAKTWHVEVQDMVTVITANFDGENPNKSLAEINVRKSCFYPKNSGMNYIRVKGLKISQAATPWAPPTSQQWGAIGPNWSLGWIIEDCEVSNSKCVGISLGKERASGENMWELYRGKNGYSKYGFTREIESILAANDLGWNKDRVGSHIIQNNKIFDCGQAGIVGHMGCAFSTIRHNEIYNINTNKELIGWEVAGIKLHAAIDAVIEDNVIINAGRGLWLDWQAQGTKVIGNIFDKNVIEDIFIEVSHGPTLVYNNIMLSEQSMTVNAQGIAYFNNLIGSKVNVFNSNDRYTPYHHAHSTQVRGLYNNNGGDIRLYNNILLGRGVGTKGVNGFKAFDKYPVFDPHMGDKLESIPDYLNFLFPIWTNGNCYFGSKSQPYKNEQQHTIYAKEDKYAKVVKKDGKYYLDTDIDFEKLGEVATIGVNTEMLGETLMSELIFDNADGTYFQFEDDFFGRKRNLSRPTVGPFESNFGDRPIWE